MQLFSTILLLDTQVKCASELVLGVGGGSLLVQPIGAVSYTHLTLPTTSRV